MKEVLSTIKFANLQKLRAKLGKIKMRAKYGRSAEPGEGLLEMLLGEKFEEFKEAFDSSPAYEQGKFVETLN